jgi:hypothetical protein
VARKPAEFVQFKLRIREGLRRDLEREARKKDHSANQEAVDRLERSFSAEKESQRTDLVLTLLEEIKRHLDAIHPISEVQ